MDVRFRLQQAVARMWNLEPLTTRLVDDILRTLRGATLDELAELLGGRVNLRASAIAALAERPAMPRSGAAASRKAGKRAGSLLAPRVSAATPSSGEPRTTSAAREPPVSAEITDPEWLLAATMPSATQRAPRVALPSILVSGPESPANGARAAVHSTPVLRAGESLARASGGSVVIRRTRRA